MTNFTQLAPSHIAELKKLASEVITGSNIHEDYFHDELAGAPHPPEAVVRPRSTAEVSAVMKYAYDNNIPVTPRGQGTGLVGGSVSLYGGIMLDMTAMNKILEIDRENLTMTVEPGVLLMEIPPAIQSMGLFYPPDPGEKSASIGGNISTNAGGMRAVKYGVTRDYVRGLEVVLADGRIMELGQDRQKQFRIQSFAADRRFRRHIGRRDQSHSQTDPPAPQKHHPSCAFSLSCPGYRDSSGHCKIPDDAHGGGIYGTCRHSCCGRVPRTFFP